jgi:hypothetical protein
VKALEWDEVTQARSDEDPHREVIGWECSTGFDGFYIVEITGGGASLTTTNYDCTYYGSPDEAKAAAQADFEARVLSALTAPPAREISEAEVERAARAIDALWSEGQDRGPAFEDTEREYQAHCRSTARAALEAARSPA